MADEKITIIYPPSMDYNFMHQRPQQLMKAFAQAGATVIYINPADIYPYVEDISIPFALLPNFIVVKKGVPYEHLIEGRVVIYAAVNQGEFIDETPHDLSVFDSCDLATDEFVAWKDVVPQMEQRTDLTCTSAQIIYDEHVKRGANTILVPNGADYEHFAPAAKRLDRPKDMPNVGNRFTIGYYGAVYTWLDVQLIKTIADYFPVVMIGKNDLYSIPLEHQNITSLGIKRYDELPSYLSWFDVAIIPFKLTQMIKGCDPVKCYEYLSAGKPVVASAMEELKKFEDIMYFGDNESIIRVISRAIRENSADRIAARQETARQHSWLSRATYALDHIKKLLAEK
jgi:glycosyltransferase involved in cell wall biosynthesis